MRVLAFSLGLLLSACTSMQRYGTARTLPPGELGVIAAVDLVQGYEPQAEDWFETALPWGIPRVGLRYGAGEGTELGLEASAGNFTFDAKRELLRSRWIDLALAPAVTAGMQGPGDHEPVAIVQVPLLVGVHATDWLTFVPQASVGYGARYVSPANFFPERDARWVGTPLVGAGLGVFVRLADWLALQPLAGMNWELDSGYRYTSGGLGAFFGSVPERSSR